MSCLEKQLKTERGIAITTIDGWLTMQPGSHLLEARMHPKVIGRWFADATEQHPDAL